MKHDSTTSSVEPGSIVFCTDPDSDIPFNIWHLTRLTMEGTPVAAAITTLVAKVEDALSSGSLCYSPGMSWRFEFYMHASHGGEDSECAVRFSGPDFFVKLFDADGTRILAGWTMMINFCGDLLLKKGPATNSSPMGSPEVMYGVKAEAKIIRMLKSHFSRQVKREEACST